MAIAFFWLYKVLQKKIDFIDMYTCVSFIKQPDNETVLCSSQNLLLLINLYLVYHQVQVGLGNRLDPNDWGLKTS